MRIADFSISRFATGFDTGFYNRPRYPWEFSKNSYLSDVRFWQCSSLDEKSNFHRKGSSTFYQSVTKTKLVKCTLSTRWREKKEQLGSNFGITNERRYYYLMHGYDQIEFVYISGRTRNIIYWWLWDLWKHLGCSEYFSQDPVNLCHDMRGVALSKNWIASDNSADDNRLFRRSHV